MTISQAFADSSLFKRLVAFAKSRVSCIELARDLVQSVFAERWRLNPDKIFTDLEDAIRYFCYYIKKRAQDAFRRQARNSAQRHSDAHQNYYETKRLRADAANYVLNLISDGPLWVQEVFGDYIHFGNNHTETALYRGISLSGQMRRFHRFVAWIRENNSDLDGRPPPRKPRSLFYFLLVSNLGRKMMSGFDLMLVKSCFQKELNVMAIPKTMLTATVDNCELKSQPGHLPYGFWRNRRPKVNGHQMMMNRIKEDRLRFLAMILEGIDDWKGKVDERNIVIVPYTVSVSENQAGTVSGTELVSQTFTDPGNDRRTHTVRVLSTSDSSLLTCEFCTSA